MIGSIQKEMEKALSDMDKELIETIERAAANIRAYHERQRENSWFMTREDGTILGQKVTPLSRGVYAPAGTAPLPSTVLMDIIPARVGCGRGYPLFAASEMERLTPLFWPAQWSRC